MTVRRLPRVHPPEGPEPEGLGPDHPMRRVTREVAFDASTWTAERAAKVASLFDELASEWHTRDRPGRLTPLVDALERGGPFPAGLTIELGSGSGLGTRVIVTRLPHVVAVDLSLEMLRVAPPVAPRVRGDGARLPVADGRVGTLVAMNMLLFPSEVSRVLAPDGVLLWVNTVGDATPIHLSADEVDAALPGDWELVAADASWGTWCAARRAAPPSATG